MQRMGAVVRGFVQIRPRQIPITVGAKGLKKSLANTKKDYTPSKQETASVWATETARQLARFR